MVTSRSKVKKVVVEGPLAPFLDAFRADLEERGFAAVTRNVELQHMARLSRWLAAEGLAVVDLDEEQIERFLA